MRRPASSPSAGRYARATPISASPARGPTAAAGAATPTPTASARPAATSGRRNARLADVRPAAAVVVIAIVVSLSPQPAVSLSACIDLLIPAEQVEASQIHRADESHRQSRA